MDTWQTLLGGGSIVATIVFIWYLVHTFIRKLK